MMRSSDCSRPPAKRAGSRGLTPAQRFALLAADRAARKRLGLLPPRPSADDGPVHVADVLRVLLARLRVTRRAG